MIDKNINSYVKEAWGALDLHFYNDSYLYK